jgi:tRNA modification GTPase
MQNDTIAAIATAMSPSGIGIVRISGDDALSVIDRIYKSKNNKTKISACQSHTIHYGFIYDGDEKIDEVMVLLMKAPNTYTREDTVEIDCHGGVYVMKRVLEAVIKNGARPAEPGEFTKRAFLNGRIDLSQAESVIDVINSKNDFALKSSLSQLGGAVLGSIRQIREQLLHEIAFIESALDDPEHISLDGYPQKLRVIVDNEYVEMCSGSSSADSIKAISCKSCSLICLMLPSTAPPSWLKELLSAKSFFEFITSITDSAWDKSILPFKNALLVNSPGSAGLAPFLITASSTLFITYTPPWQSISTVSSLVYVLGAFIKSTITSSIFSSPSYIKP